MTCKPVYELIKPSHIANFDTVWNNLALDKSSNTYHKIITEVFSKVPDAGIRNSAIATAVADLRNDMNKEEVRNRTFGALKKMTGAGGKPGNVCLHMTKKKGGKMLHYRKCRYSTTKKLSDWPGIADKLTTGERCSSTTSGEECQECQTCLCGENLCNKKGTYQCWFARVLNIAARRVI